MHKENEFKKIINGPVMDFLVKRMNARNYRGTHIFQHYRLESSDILVVLKAIKSVSDGEIEIPPGDEYHPKRKPSGFKIGEYPDYAKILEILSENFSKNSKSGRKKSSANQFKKGILVDLARIGIIQRYKISRNGVKEMCAPDEKKCLTKKIKISEEGIKILKENENSVLLEKIAKLVVQSFEQVYETIYKLIDDFDNLSEIEYTLFGSFVNNYFADGSRFKIEECTEIIKKFRNLGKNTQDSITTFLKENSISEMAKKESEYWDWGNWKNETQTIFKWLSTTKLFVKKGEVLSLNFGFKNNSKTNLKRDKRVIEKYAKFHGIPFNKNFRLETGFEFHHIVSISYAQDLYQLSEIDHFKNVLCVSGTAHNLFPNRKNLLIFIRKKSENQIEIYSLGNVQKSIVLEIGKDVRFDISKIEEYINYNEHLIKNVL